MEDPSTTQLSKRTYNVRVPASTSNLGPGFDCLSLALQLYLTVTATVTTEQVDPCVVSNKGEGSSDLPSGENNLIFRAMQFVAERESLRLPSLHLEVQNNVPLGRGLGSSAAAIVAGILLSSLICERELSTQEALAYASEMEGHADNVAAALHGGLVVTCVQSEKSVLAVKKSWPDDLKVIVVSPEAKVNTEEARRLLPETIHLEDAIFNIQRVSLLLALIESGDYDFLWEAMQDRLHQPMRRWMVPGLSEALATSRQTGLLGVALSGSGPSVVAIANDRCAELGDDIAGKFRSAGVEATVRLLEVDHVGAVASKQ